jgi:hypothetical protein
MTETEGFIIGVSLLVAGAPLFVLALLVGRTRKHEQMTHRTHLALIRSMRDEVARQERIITTQGQEILQLRSLVNRTSESVEPRPTHLRDEEFERNWYTFNKRPGIAQKHPAGES